MNERFGELGSILLDNVLQKAEMVKRYKESLNYNLLGHALADHRPSCINYPMLNPLEKIFQMEEILFAIEEEKVSDTVF